MGRRGVGIEEEGRWVFDRLAQDYLARPGYPQALVARLVALAGGPGARVAELGAGTGHLALPLSRAGLRVAAVEPSRAMRAALETRVASEAQSAAEAHAWTEGHAATQAGTLEAIAGTAERSTLPAGAFSLVVLADALHWVDPELAGREIARLLAPGGVAAVVEPRLADTPFLRALQARLAQVNPRARAKPSTRAARQLLALAAPAAPPHEESFSHEERLPPERLDAVLRSLSYVGPALGPEALATLLADARALADAHGGAVWTRTVMLTHATRAS